jgi:Ca2+-transporting ATPase
MADFFNVVPLNLSELGIVLLISVVSVLWFEVYKGIKRLKNKQHVNI